MPKREYNSSFRRLRKRLAPRKVCEVVEAGTSSGSAGMGSPPSFKKVMKSKYQIHTSVRQCALTLPKAFCDKHNVANRVTMTDSTRHTLWHMRCQNHSAAQGLYISSNGWREFPYDHSLKRNDKLMFTLISPSHFVVEFATSKGFTRVMRPTRDGTEYPYPWRNYSENGQGMAMATTILPKARKRTPQLGEILRGQCSTVKVQNRNSNSTDSTRMHNLPKLTHLECKNPDGTSYLQILDSGSEVTDGDEENVPEYNQGNVYIFKIQAVQSLVSYTLNDFVAQQSSSDLQQFLVKDFFQLKPDFFHMLLELQTDTDPNFHVRRTMNICQRKIFR